MTEAEIEALWSQKLSIYEFARSIERDTLKRAIEVGMNAALDDPRQASFDCWCRVCNAIRALMNESVASKED